jgi:hypothetical protein
MLGAPGVPPAATEIGQTLAPPEDLVPRAAPAAPTAKVEAERFGPPKPTEMDELAGLIDQIAQISRGNVPKDWTKREQMLLLLSGAAVGASRGLRGATGDAGGDIARVLAGAGAGGLTGLVGGREERRKEQQQFAKEAAELEISKGLLGVRMKGVEAARERTQAYAGAQAARMGLEQQKLMKEQVHVTPDGRAIVYDPRTKTTTVQLSDFYVRFKALEDMSKMKGIGWEDLESFPPAMRPQVLAALHVKIGTVAPGLWDSAVDDANKQMVLESFGSGVDITKPEDVMYNLDMLRRADPTNFYERRDALASRLLMGKLGANQQLLGGILKQLGGSAEAPGGQY